MKMMMTLALNIKNVVLIFIFTDIPFLLYGLLLEDINWIINTQVAFFGTALIMGSTFLSYKVNIDKKSNIDLKEQFKDTIDKIEDRYDLYDEEEIVESFEEDANKLFEEEKRKNKKKFFSNIGVGSKLFFSIYRVIAYVIFVLAIMYLITNSIFSIWGFMVGILINIVAIFVLTAFTKAVLNKNQSIKN